MSKHYNPLAGQQECTFCDVMTDTELLVSCSACGFDTCPECMVDDKCTDCDENFAPGLLDE